MKKIGSETFWGGIFGIIAILSSVGEMILNNYSMESIVGAVKDISGIITTVMILIFAVKNLLPDAGKYNFEERLKNKLALWQESNSTLIVKSEDDEKTNKYGFNMKTDVSEFYRTHSLKKNSGWFVRLPLILEDNYNKEKVEINFHLNKGTFFEGISLSADELSIRFEKLNRLFCDFINNKYNNLLTASGNKNDIRIVFHNPIHSDEDIQKLIDVLNSMLQAYLVSANIRV